MHMICNFEIIKTAIDKNNPKALKEITAQFYNCNSIELQKKILLLLLRKVRKNILHKYKVLGEYNEMLIKINQNRLKEGVHELLYMIYRKDIEKAKYEGDDTTVMYSDIEASRWTYIKFQKKEISTSHGYVFIDSTHLVFYSPVENYVINLKSIMQIEKNEKLFLLFLKDEKRLYFDLSENQLMFKERLREKFDFIEEELSGKKKPSKEKTLEDLLSFEEKSEEENDEKRPIKEKTLENLLSIEEEIEKKSGKKMQIKEETLEDLLSLEEESEEGSNESKDLEDLHFLKEKSGEVSNESRPIKEEDAHENLLSLKEEPGEGIIPIHPSVSLQRSSLNQVKLEFNSESVSNFGKNLLIKIKKPKKEIFSESYSPDKEPIKERSENPINPKMSTLKIARKKLQVKKVKKTGHCISRNITKFIKRLTKRRLKNLNKAAKKEAKKIRQRGKALKMIMQIFKEKYTKEIF